MTNGERDTFLPAGELLARAIVYSSAIVQRLGRIRATPDGSRVALIQNAYKQEQSRLTTTLERYANEAAPQILDTFAQYAVPLPDPQPEPASPLTPEALTQWMLDLNRPLFDLFSEVADAVEATSAHDVFENLAELVRNHEMRIVQAADGAQDL
jgi:hypothetical protein